MQRAGTTRPTTTRRSDRAAPRNGTATDARGAKKRRDDGVRAPVTAPVANAGGTPTDARAKTNAGAVVVEAPRVSTRTCVACRQTGMRGELVRLVVGPDGRVTIDPRTRVGGRGAWVHASRRCLGLAAQRHAAERSLGVGVQTVDAKALADGLAEAFRRRCASLVAIAQRKAALVIGTEAVTEYLNRGTSAVVLMAGDAGGTSRSLLDDVTADPDARAVVRTYGTRDELGRWLGRAEVALLAVTDGQIASELTATLDRLAGLEG